jgi:hypothetical protein
MTIALICGLAIAVLYLATRWTRVRDENVTLRAQVASLKRRLSRRDA